MPVTMRRAKLALLGRGAMSLASIGPIMQIAFVPDDFDAALRHWTEVMGVGPFFVLENIRLDAMRYRGQPSDCCFTIAIGYWGDLQVELIRQEDDAPSIYRDMRNGGALHHVCLLTVDIDAARRAADDAGCTLLVEAKVGADGAVIYVDSNGYPGGIVEILQPASGTEGVFSMMRAAARDWDGTEPIRRLD